MKAWPVVALAWCVVLACAAPAKMSQTSAPPPVAPPQGMPASPHDQIQQLSDKIDAQRTQMGLPEAPQAVSMAAGMPPQACVHGTSQACTDVCTLSDSICDNAKKICDLAAQLPGDGWAADHCTRGKATCDAAHERCCSCQ